MSVTTATLLAGLAGKVFLGEAYPTGNAYLQAFVADTDRDVSFEQRPPLESWPSALTAHCLNAKGCADKEVGNAPRAATRAAYFVPELARRADKKQNIVVVTYDSIPAREGLDAGHDQSCGLKYKKDKARRYADGTDYFDTVFDYCFFDEPIVRYELARAPRTAAYQVLAVAAELTLENVQHGGAKEKRPASKAEAALEAAQKSRAARMDCSTEPASIRDAAVVFTATVKGTGRALRLSTYQDPGCGGHLTRIYLLDVLEGGKVAGTYLATRYIGPI